MGLQMFMDHSRADQRAYSPSRDLAHCFADMIRRVVVRLQDGRWEVIAKLCAEKGVTPEQTGKACQALCDFAASVVELDEDTGKVINQKETMEEQLKRCGWWDVPETAQVAVLSVLGTVVMGYAWAGIKEATLGGVGPCLRAKDLSEAGRLCCEAMTQSR